VTAAAASQAVGVRRVRRVDGRIGRIGLFLLASPSEPALCRVQEHGTRAVESGWSDLPRVRRQAHLATRQL